MVRCRAVAISGGDATGQDALNGATVEPFEDLGTDAIYFQSPDWEKVLLCPLLDCLMFVGDVDTKELETLNPLHYSPVDVNGGLFSPPCPVVDALHSVMVMYIE
jgi:hypothetical protein